MSDEKIKVYVVVEDSTGDVVIRTGVLCDWLSGNNYLIAHGDGTREVYPEKVVFFSLRVANFHKQERTNQLATSLAYGSL